MVKNKSPLRYPGGKTRACKVLEDLLLQHFDMSSFDTVVSPFFGGGSFEFYLQNKYNFDIIANDKFTPLYHFWTQSKNNKQSLCERIQKDLGQVTKETCKLYRKELLDSLEETRVAHLFFILNRCSFSGCTLSGGFSGEAIQKRFTKSSIDRIRLLDLSKFTMENVDFELFLQKNLNGLLFVDPPYYLEKEKSKLYGTDGNLHENFNHEKLCQILSQHSNWILTYNDCEYIRNLYKDYRIREVHWGYGMNQSKKSSEIVIIKQL